LSAFFNDENLYVYSNGSSINGKSATSIMGSGPKTEFYDQKKMRFAFQESLKTSLCSLDSRVLKAVEDKTCLCARLPEDKTCLLCKVLRRQNLPFVQGSFYLSQALTIIITHLKRITCQVPFAEDYLLKSGVCPLVLLNGRRTGRTMQTYEAIGS
jgi:hypothetical protein